MLTPEQVLPTCYYWAKRLRTPGIPFDELVNEAYTAAVKLRSPLLLQKWVKWRMIGFLKKRKATVYIVEGADVEDTSFDFKEFMEMQDELMGVIDKTCSAEEQKLLFLLFWRDMTYEEAAKHLGLSGKGGVFFRIQKVLEKIRREYERAS